jgi:hypothetical protein
MIRNYSYRYPGSMATHGGHLPVHTLYAATIQDAKYLVSRKRLHLAIWIQTKIARRIGCTWYLKATETESQSQRLNPGEIYDYSGS